MIIDKLNPEETVTKKETPTIVEERVEPEVRIYNTGFEGIESEMKLSEEARNYSPTPSNGSNSRPDTPKIGPVVPMV